MEEIWIEVWGFDDYEVSNHGRVRNVHTRKFASQSIATGGAVKVNIFRGGKRTTRSVKVLVAFAFVGGQTDLCDTPIHLDNDQMNNRADNLAWRPRWYAWQYRNQFTNPEVASKKLRIRDVDTDIIYANPLEAAMAHGLLVKDIMRSITFTKRIWPTDQLFSIAKVV